MFGKVLFKMDRWLKIGILKRGRPTDEEKQELDVIVIVNCKAKSYKPYLFKSSVKPTVKIKKYSYDYLEIGFTYWT